jgi:2-polyprenyl-3-methyl-5-hydroxy-6-metoxy-1,4-benzoquinol methylase
MINFLRNLVYPGLDLHTRNRASLTVFWKKGQREVLDAGSGNGYFSWLAYRSGAKVVALNYEVEQVKKAKEFLIDYRGADPQRISFEQYNLYNLKDDLRTFDEIICFEVLEHIRGDNEIVQSFFKVLKPGGVLHLCCPHKDHPRHQVEVLDQQETGGHVRQGYDEKEYRRLLEGNGFRVEDLVGIGPPSVYLADKFLRWIRSVIGDVAALPLFPLLLPTVYFAKFNPEVPFSLYVRAVKPLL